MVLTSLDKYGPEFQVKIIHSLITRKEFLHTIHDILNPLDFSSSSNQWIIKEILNYYQKYHTVPTIDVLKVEIKKIDNDILQTAVKEQLSQAYQVSQDDINYVEEEFTSFCKNQQLKKALLSSVDLLKAEDYDSIRILVDNALKAGQDKNLGHEYHKDVESRFREDYRVVVPTPWPEINELLQGGLGNGDFGLVFGNPGGGKSWSLVALGGHALLKGHNVIHYTLELRSEYVGKRYDAFFTKIPVNEIIDHRQDVERKINELKGNLIIKHYSPGKASILTLENHIKKCINMGFKPDLIIIDYVDLLSSRKKNRERKEEIDDIYVSTKGLAGELNLPIWSASQVNRAGAKDDVIEGDKSSGSYDKIMITDVCISLSRKKEDKVNGTGRFHIMKNRYGLDGMTYNVDIDTSTGRIDIKEQFTGSTSSMSDEDATKAALLKEFKKVKLF